MTYTLPSLPSIRFMYASSMTLVLISVITLVLLHFRLPDSCLLVRVRFRLRHIGGDAHPCVQNRNLHPYRVRSEEHTSELQSRENLVCRLLLAKKKGRGIYFVY